jgi:hypothetical protein
MISPPNAFQVGGDEAFEGLMSVVAAAFVRGVLDLKKGKSVGGQIVLFQDAH